MITFIGGPMGCGKSTLLLQDYYNVSEALLLTGGSDGTIRSRALNAEKPAKKARVPSDLTLPLTMNKYKYVFVDEAQFLVPGAVKELARYVDDNNGTLRFYGLISDFKGEMFPGTAQAIALADEVVTLPSLIPCSCGGRAIINARIHNGTIVYNGMQIVEGDIEESEMYYKPMCRKCWRAGSAQNRPSA